MHEHDQRAAIENEQILGNWQNQEQNLHILRTSKKEALAFKYIYLFLRLTLASPTGYLITTISDEKSGPGYSSASHELFIY
jgi:hypothetical protein